MIGNNFKCLRDIYVKQIYIEKKIDLMIDCFEKRQLIRDLDNLFMYEVEFILGGKEMENIMKTAYSYNYMCDIIERFEGKDIFDFVLIKDLESGVVIRNDNQKDLTDLFSKMYLILNGTKNDYRRFIIEEVQILNGEIAYNGEQWRTNK